jgi:NAD(P)H-dependent FMN reductase
MSHRPHILVILGSTRQGRHGDMVATWVLGRVRECPDATFALVDLRELALPLFDAALPPAFGTVAAAALGWAERVDGADGYVFITPEYNHGYPAPLKNAVDHLYREWAHKPAAIVSYGGYGGGYRAAEQLRQVLIELKMVPVREQVGVPAIWAAFDDAGAPRAHSLGGALDAMVTELLWWTRARILARERDRAAARSATAD